MLFKAYEDSVRIILSFFQYILYRGDVELKESIIDSGRRMLYMGTMTQITGNKVLEISSCRKIIEYNDVYLKIKTSNMLVEIWGSELLIDDYNTEGIVVRGEIKSVEFSKAVKKNAEKH